MEVQRRQHQASPAAKTATGTTRSLPIASNKAGCHEGHGRSHEQARGEATGGAPPDVGESENRRLVRDERWGLQASRCPC